MSISLSTILNHPKFKHKLFTEAQTQGFITAMASTPSLINPEEWLSVLWHGKNTPPFDTAEELENYASTIVELWNSYRGGLLSGQWCWPEACQLNNEEIITIETRQFCEGLLQGWQLTRDDWETLMPEGSENGALLGGVLLSISMLFDPATTLITLKEEGVNGLEEFADIYNAIPMMLSGITIRANELAKLEAKR